MKYHSKPFVIEAMKLTKESLMEVFHWCDAKEWKDDPVELKIRTSEGLMTARDGDFVVNALNGDFYPCKAETFESTFDKVLSGELCPKE